MTGNAINYLLSNAAAVTTIVGDRIYPNRAPQGVTGDYVVFRRIDANPSDIKDSVSPLDKERWQVDGYCDSDEDRDNLGEAIRDALDYQKGTINGVNIDQIRFDDWNTGFDDDGRKFRTSADYNIRVIRS